MSEFLFTSESVTGGHPDKVADQISDAVLDEILRQDPRGRVACETMVTTGLVMVAGEITTKAIVDFPDVVRKAVIDIGYTGNSKGFDAHNCAVITAIGRQSVDIAQGVDRGDEEKQGAGPTPAEDRRRRPLAPTWERWSRSDCRYTSSTARTGSTAIP